MCTGKLSHRACTRSCASHIHTHTNSAHGRVWRSIANDLRDIGRHVRSILPNGSSNFHFAPVMPTYVCPSFLSSFSISLSLFLPRVCYFRPISLPLPRGAIHILGIQKGERERERAIERKRERGRKFTDFKNRPDFPPLWNCLGCAPSRRLTATLSLLLHPPSLSNLGPYYRSLRSLLASSFLQNWTARWNSQFATSILHLSLSFSLSSWERPLSDSPSLGERPIPLEDPLLPRRNLGQTRVREERETKCRFRTILERSISYERCRSPLAYKTFIKSPTKWTGGRRRRCTRKAGNRQQLAVRWSSNSSGLFQPTLFYRSLPLLESFRTPMAWPG